MEWDERNTIVYPLTCSLAGLVAGMFGVGGCGAACMHACKPAHAASAKVLRLARLRKQPNPHASARGQCIRGMGYISS